MCSVDGCSRAHCARGMCRPHYTKAWKAGAFKPGAYGVPTEERFFSRVSVSGVCWEWTDRLDKDGYGRFSSWDGNRKICVNYSAHRWCWEFLVGEIPEGLTLDHLCLNKACVNPDHLEPVTQAENYRRYRKTIGAGLS